MKTIKAYYIHWWYPKTADSYLSNLGSDDDKFFHFAKNANIYAYNKIKQNKEIVDKCETLYKKLSNAIELTKEEYKYLVIHCNYDSLANDFNIYERDIKFEDEE